MLARIWMDTLSTAGRENISSPTIQGPAQSLVVEQWDGTKWIERRLTWDGKSYVEVR